MREWIATDLDGTLFSRGWAADDAIPATWRSDPSTGARIASSWMPSSIHRAMMLLQLHCAIVPVTARDAESFARVAIDRIPLSGPAVIANGALVYDLYGRLDSDWLAEMTHRLYPWRGWMEAALVHLSVRCAGHARARLVEGPAGLPAYLVAKAPGGWWQSENGTQIRETLNLDGVHLSVLGDELQILPPGVGKAEALRMVMDVYFDGSKPLFCFGDMPGDLAFMRIGRILTTPRNSHLDKAWPD